MMSHKLLTGLLLLGLACLPACGDDSEDTASNNQANNDANNQSEAFSPDCTTLIKATSDAETNRINIQTALTEPKSGDVVCLANGTYPIDGQIQLNITDLTGFEIRGESQDGTILDFKDQTDGGNGILVDGVNEFRAANFTIKNTIGDGIKVQNGKGIELVNLTVTWDGGPKEENGAYGVYPVLTENVLIEGCVVSYASDAGIYVGQTKNVIVRNNEAFGNVAGLELENTSHADAYDNHLHDNTGGFLIFDLPNLDVTDGSTNKVHNNLIENNNQVNFAPQANIVALVPRGTGILVLASSNNEIHDNTIRGNKSLGIIVASFLATQRPLDDPDYHPYSESNYIHDNVFENNGTDPAGMATQIGSAPVPDLAIDGVLDPEVPAGNKSFEEARDCFSNNKMADGSDAPFINADLMNDTWDAFTDCSEDWHDFCHYQCEGTELPAITLE